MLGLGLYDPPPGKIITISDYQYSYFHNYMEQWIPCRSEIRNKKLEELGIN